MGGGGGGGASGGFSNDPSSGGGGGSFGGGGGGGTSLSLDGFSSGGGGLQGGGIGGFNDKGTAPSAKNGVAGKGGYDCCDKTLAGRYGLGGGDAFDTTGGSGGPIGGHGQTSGSGFGGAGGMSGAIDLSGKTVALNGTIDSSLGFPTNFGIYTVAGRSINIDIATGPGVTSSSIYSSDANYLDSAPYLVADVTGPLPAFIVNNGSSSNVNGSRGYLRGIEGITIAGHLLPSDHGTEGSYGGSEVPITLNGLTLRISNGAIITPAELVAAIQVSNTGSQQLLLDSSGNASGGSLTLGAANLPAGGVFTNLKLPAGVSMTLDLPSLTATATAVIAGEVITAAPVNFDLPGLNVTTSGKTYLSGYRAGNANFTLLTTGDITSNSFIISQASVAPPIKGGNIDIRAGVNWSPLAGGGAIVHGPTGGSGSIIMPSMSLVTSGGDITLAANGVGAQVQVSSVKAAGYGSRPDFDEGGQQGGAITITAPGNITTLDLWSFGGGGGGSGGAITVNSVSGNLSIGGDINSSGGGGAGGDVSYHYAGVGGNGGNISLSSPGIITVAGPVLAAGGGGGGAAAIAGGGGGGSFAGGGGGGSGSPSTGGGAGGGGGALYGGAGGGRANGQPSFGGAGGLNGPGVHSVRGGFDGLVGAGGYGSDNGITGGGGVGGDFGLGGAGGTYTFAGKFNGAAGGMVGSRGSNSEVSTGGAQGSGGRIQIASNELQNKWNHRLILWIHRLTLFQPVDSFIWTQWADRHLYL